MQRQTKAWQAPLFRLFRRSSQPQAREVKSYGMSRAYMVAPGQPVWMDRDYRRFSDEAYMRNVIAFRAVQMVTQAAASIPWELYRVNTRAGEKEITSHPLLNLLARPNPQHGFQAFFESLFSYRMISGNVFVQAVGPKGEAPLELHLLRPDRMAVIAGKQGLPAGYRYTVGEHHTDFPVDRLTGQSAILHIKNFHPLNDWYGLSPVEAAAYSIDQHNHSSAWNQALLQNGARPSGALIVRTEGGQTGSLSDEQFQRIRQQIDEQFAGPENAGRPLLLEGGLEWKEMSLSPRDMDFISVKNSAARDIALAFGVPPQLLGIPGDNTYSNLQEARYALWEQTVIPMAEMVCREMSQWLAPHYGAGLELRPNPDGISAIGERNQALWQRVENASFLTENEKRAAVGYPPLEEEVS